MVFVGGPGLVVGAGIAAVMKGWRVLALLTLAVAIGLFYAVRHIQSSDEQAGVLLAMAAFTNFAGWIVGLLIGSLTARLTSPRPAAGD
jgi:hypothetical protein